MYALHHQFDCSQTTGADVIICGHGAFGAENVRTCCEFSARRIDVLCRRQNLCCPRMASWLANQVVQRVSGALFMRGMEAA